MSASERVRAEVRGFVRSFAFAISGALWILRTQRNAKIQALAAILAIALGILRPRIWGGETAPLAPAEWSLLFLAIALALCAEALNTALESLADAVDEKENIRVKRAKDAAAAGSLLASLGALGVGIAVLGPF